MTIGERIKMLMQSKSLTYRKLAEDTQIPLSTITYWTSDKTLPSADMISALADYFAVSTDYLLGKTLDPRPFPAEDTRSIDEKLADAPFAFALYEGSQNLTDDQKKEILEIFEFVKSKHDKK